MIKDAKDKFDVRELVPKEVYDTFKESSWQFVSDNIMKLLVFMYNFFTSYYTKDANVEKISILINNWHIGGPFQNRGLRTVTYIMSQVAKKIKTAMLSQHVGGSTNAIDFNIIVHYKDGRRELINSDKIFDIIIASEKEFLEAGLTTLENKTMTQGWTHADCRYTGLNKIYVVNP
jgi:hypothetical protein